MHFQKSARQWWVSLRANGEASRTWKNLRASIMKQFLSSDAKDKVLTEWRSLKLTPYESIHKYVDKFWDLHLKATVYKKIDFEEQKQQFYAGLPEDMNEYVNSQRPKTISAVIHHTMVAARINFQQGAKRNLKPMETKEKHEPKGKNHPQNFPKVTSNNKAKEKGVYKGKNRLTPEELERYRKDNRCFKCGEQGHSYRTCPKRNTGNEQPRASIIESPKEDVHCKGSPLSYAWGKERGENIPSEDSFDIARRVKEAYCYTCADIVKEFGKHDKEPAKYIKEWSGLHTKTGSPYVCEVGYERFLAPEVFFSPEIYNSDFTTSLPEVVDHCIQSAPIDTRRALYKNIVLSGGSTMFKDFQRRLQRDLKKIVDARVQATISKHGLETQVQAVDVNVVSHPIQRFAVWFGGSVLGSTPEFYTACHTKAEYDEYGPSICRTNPVFKGMF
ncbi:hypothetical protein L7F22_005667 [Adiantum nelumboides]|nr:hypothetical protein [Adiantum nelumboides]